MLALAIIPGLSGDDGPRTSTSASSPAPTPPLLAGALERVDLGDDTKVKTRLVADRDEARRLVDADDLDAAVDGDAVIVKDKLKASSRRSCSSPTATCAPSRRSPPPGCRGSRHGHHRPAAVRMVPIEPPNSRTGRAAHPRHLRRLHRAQPALRLRVRGGQQRGRGEGLPGGRADPRQDPASPPAGRQDRRRRAPSGSASSSCTSPSGWPRPPPPAPSTCPPASPAATALVLGWFVLGFTFYAALFAMAGAIASRVEELQNTTVADHVRADGWLPGRHHHRRRPGRARGPGDLLLAVLGPYGDADPHGGRRGCRLGAGGLGRHRPGCRSSSSSASPAASTPAAPSAPGAGSS